jgi:hypothetical protein
MPRTIDTQFWIGDRVFRVTDSDNRPGLILGVTIGPNCLIQYRTSFDGEDSTYYEMELQDTPSWDLTDHASVE